MTLITRPVPTREVLRHLTRSGPVPTDDICRALGITPRQAGAALRRLRDLHLVEPTYGPRGTHVPAVADVPADLL